MLEDLITCYWEVGSMDMNRLDLGNTLHKANQILQRYQETSMKTPLIVNGHQIVSNM